MKKKLISLFCCLLPVGAGAAPLYPESPNTVVSTSQFPTDGSSVVIGGGNGIDAPTGFSVANSMYVGAESDQGTQTGALYVLNTAASPFTVVAGGDVSVGAMLQVLDGWNLQFVGAGTGMNASFGSIENNGILELDAVSDFQSGAIVSDGMLTVGAETVNAGAIDIKSGGATIDADGDVAFDGMVVQGTGDVKVESGTQIESDGNIQNNAGKMTLAATNLINVQGNLQNNGNGLSVAGGDFVVAGTMTNSAAGSVLDIDVNSWTVNGGDASTTSFVNNGVLDVNVVGRTYLANGMNLSGMASDVASNMVTGQLEFGANAQILSDLNNFNLTVKNGGIAVGSISNGISNASGASMVVKASGDVVTNVIRNNGNSLTVNAANITANGAADADSVNTAIVGAGGTVTKLVASNTLTANGAVANNGNMTLNANAVNLQSVSNSGANSEMQITSLTDKTGVIKINGNVTNAIGDTTIWAKDVSVTGSVINNSGTTNLRGSDNGGGAVVLGALDVNGGTLNLDALAGAVSITNGIDVDGGMLNLGGSLRNLAVGKNVHVAGNITTNASGALANNDMNIAATGTPVVVQADSVFVDGNVSVSTGAGAPRGITFDTPVVNIAGNASVGKDGYLEFGTVPTSYAKVAGNVQVDSGGVLEVGANNLYAGSISGDGLFLMHGANVEVGPGNVNVAGNLYFDTDNLSGAPASGIVVSGTQQFVMETTGEKSGISVGAVTVGAADDLTLKSADYISLNGAVNNSGKMAVTAKNIADITNTVTNSGDLDVVAGVINIADVKNTDDMLLSATNGAVNTGSVTNAGDLTVDAFDAININGAFAQNAGVADVTANTVNMQSLSVNGNVGTQLNLNADKVAVSGNAIINGDFYQGGTDGIVNWGGSNFDASNLTVGGNLFVNSDNATYTVGTSAKIVGTVYVADNAGATFNVNNIFSAGAIDNKSELFINAQRGADVDNVVNAGILDINSGTGLFESDNITFVSGNMILDGRGMYTDGAIDTGAMLYQGYNGVLQNKDINVAADEYAITTDWLSVSGIQQDGKLVINTSDIDVGGDIVASDLQFIAQTDQNGNTIWQNVEINGNVSGNVDFIGLEKMTINNGNYDFSTGSMINAAILPNVSGTANTTDINYWASVDLNDGATLGQIINPTGADARALITVGGVFTSGIKYDESGFGLTGDAAKLENGQIGITLYDTVNQGDAIWLLHADSGIKNASDMDLLRNLNVRYCNANGSICYDYMDSLADNNDADTDLPAYISVRDANDDGVLDDMYVVFDPRFGGPVLLNDLKIQPIVGAADDSTNGEYVSAGALDNMIAGQLFNRQFFNKTPIEVLPLLFQGTNLETMANELYLRMEDYVQTSNGDALARFGRLFQVREIEQIMGGMALNEHTTFRSFEDRMLDEFIWNRNRDLNKAWLDVDYGMFYQNIDDGKHTNGNRFSISGGFDWQASNTLVLGLTGRVTRTSSDASDSMDLGYLANQSIMGQVATDVADTSIALGGYMMQTLGEKARLYGNMFADLHLFDIERNQNFVDRIDGDGMAFSLISEWGLMHDILNQYIVGNLYARFGYNFGVDITEQVNGMDYMDLESDGYFMLTPGYTLMAQKRIYPSAWFQIRPYASIGVEYDVFGMPDDVQYKFAVAYDFTDYAIDIDPLWANIGGGIEFLSANGLQFGVDYRYQYNDAIQLHNIKVSGSYRF